LIELADFNLTIMYNTTCTIKKDVHTLQARSNTVDQAKLPSPFKRLQQLLWEDKKDLLLLLVYSSVSAVLSLMLPLASQALINIIASGVFLQPLIMLSAIVLGGLLFTSFIRIIEITLLEILQQRLFVRISLYLSSHLPNIDTTQWVQGYPPELVNRFFDTMTIQKTLSKILLEFPAAIVQILVSLIFMAFYSSYFFVFNIFLLGTFVFFVMLGKNGVTTALVESTYKYKMAHALQDIARCHIAFKINSGKELAISNADDICGDYVAARRKHFSVIIRQATWSFFVNASAIASLLAIGGWLVMQGDLSLGQLVAAELMMLLLLASVNKIVLNLESWYDLLTGLDKLGYLTDLPAESSDGVDYISQKDGVEIVMHNVAYKYPQQLTPLFHDLNMRFSKGTHTAIVGQSGSGKSTLTELLLGLLQPSSGRIQINQQQLADLNLDSFRRASSLVECPNSLFSGSLRDNIIMGRKNISEADLANALDVSGLADILDTLPMGLDMHLESEGLNISSGKRQIVLLARAVVSNPELLVLDEAFHHIDAPTRRKIIAKLTSSKYPWTLVVVTHDADIVAACSYVYMFFEGEIVGKGKPQELFDEGDLLFRQLFPNFNQGGRL
jgi:ABC-type bacteriocin/lantibiotic exporter with double-glycine peptidase domain